MTGAVENLVRPFQLPQRTYPQRVLSTEGDTAPDDVTIEIGKEGQAKLFTESFSEATTSYKDIKSKETSRQTSKKHITNPDDDSQFVDVEVINKLKVEQGKGRTFQKIEYEFQNK